MLAFIVAPDSALAAPAKAKKLKTWPPVVAAPFPNRLPCLLLGPLPLPIPDPYVDVARSYTLGRVRTRFGVQATL